MNILAILFLLASISLATAESQINQICENGGRILSNWEYKINEEGVELGNCLSARCDDSSKTDANFLRQMCLAPSKSNPMLLIISYVDSDSKQSTFYQKSSQISLDHPCISSCAEKKVSSFMGLRQKKISGLQRSECVSCLKDKITSFDRKAIYFPSIDKKIFKEQRCFRFCEDVRGPFLYENKPSDSCLKCLDQKFTYLLTSAKECREIDSLGHSNAVPNTLCEGSKKSIGLEDTPKDTKYMYRTSFLSGLVDKNKDCVEIDVETLGAKHLEIVSPDHCESTKKNLEMGYRFEKGILGHLMGSLDNCFEYDLKTDGNTYKAVVEQSKCRGSVEVDNTARHATPEKIDHQSHPRSRTQTLGK